MKIVGLIIVIMSLAGGFFVTCVGILAIISKTANWFRDWWHDELDKIN